MTDQLANKLPCPGILFWEPCVVCDVLQQRRSLEGCPQHEEVCKVQILDPLPHPCMPGTQALAVCCRLACPMGSQHGPFQDLDMQTAQGSTSLGHAQQHVTAISLQRSRQSLLCSGTGSRAQGGWPGAPVFPRRSLKRALLGPHTSLASSRRYSCAMCALMEECMPAQHIMLVSPANLIAAYASCTGHYADDFGNVQWTCPGSPQAVQPCLKCKIGKPSQVKDRRPRLQLCQSRETCSMQGESAQRCSLKHT